MMKNVRMSRKNHGTGREKVAQTDISGLRGTQTLNTSVLQDDNPKTPQRRRAFSSTLNEYKNPSKLIHVETPSVPTGAPVASEEVDGGKEGPSRTKKSDSN
jgi:hypothetical protein